jgi:PAS domain S-box-containing protein
LAPSSKEKPHGPSIRIAPDRIADGVIATDLEGKVHHMNPAAERITGWTLSAAKGKDLGTVFRAADPEASRTILTRKDGTEVPIDGGRTSILDDEDEPAGTIVFFRDMTDRRAEESALRQSEELFRGLVEGIKDYAIFMLDRNGVITSWNAGAQRIKGYRADEIIGKHFSIFYPLEAVKSGWPQKELDLATADGRFEDEGWRFRKDGSRFWAGVVITAVRDAEGKLKGFAKFTRDLTQAMQVQQALRDSELRYRRLFESARDAILILDSETGTILETNPQVASLFGYGRPELFGRVLWDTPLFEDPEARRTAIEQLQRQGYSRSVDVRLRARDGKSVVVEFIGTSYRVGEGLLIQVNLRDISETRQLVQAKVEAQALAEINRRKDEFLAMLSHELRNPLSPIVNALHLMHLGGNDLGVIEHARQIIERQMGQLTRLVDDLLDVSRINTGRIRLQRVHLDLREVVGHARETARPLFESRRHEVFVEVPPDPVWVFADRTRLEQVIVNLLTNAAKYTNEGGRIDVIVERDGESALVSVRDTGIGISAQLLPRVFELFTQGERDSDRKLGGLGVGLTVVHKVVEMHGGTVEARSEGTGKGSEFVIRLPVNAPPADEPLAFSEPEAARTERLRVLVVDDNEDTAETVAIILRHAGHDVRLAHSGQAALDTAISFHPAAVILDLGLPGMDGYEVARRIRETPDLGDVRLIAVSGYAQEADRRRSKEAGVDVHLAKPVEPSRIEQILAELH